MENVQLFRARHALGKIREMEETFTREMEKKSNNEREQQKAKKVIDEYLTAARGLPAEIRTNGLGQAIAMLASRGVEKTGPKKVYEHVSDWMCRQNSPSPYRDRKEPEKALLDSIVSEPETAYRLAYIEIDAYLTWLKRFADAILEPLKKEEGQNNGENS